VLHQVGVSFDLYDDARKHKIKIYRGALVINVSSLDWYRWMIAMLDLEALPHSYIPHVHTGFSAVL